MVRERTSNSIKIPFTNVTNQDILLPDQTLLGHLWLVQPASSVELTLSG